MNGPLLSFYKKRLKPQMQERGHHKMRAGLTKLIYVAVLRGPGTVTRGLALEFVLYV